MDLAGQRATGSGQQRALLLRAAGTIGNEAEAGKLADRLALDENLAGARHRTLQRAAILHATQQQGLAAIDEPLGQRTMQRVRELVLHRAGAFLPVGRVSQPAHAMGDIGPGADMGDAGHQRVDIALGMVQARHLGRHPIGGQALGAGREMAENLGQ